jgi:hypothetical protein
LKRPKPIPVDVAPALPREVEVVRESAASSARRPHARGVAPAKATKTKTDRATASRPANVTRARAKKASVAAPATVAREVVHESRAVSAARPHAHGGVPVVPQGRKAELQLPSAPVAAAVPRLGDDEKVGILGYGNVGLNPSAPSAAFVQYIGTTNPYSVTIVAGGVQQTINVVPEQVINPQVAVAVYLLAQYPNFWQAVNGWTPPPSGAPSGPLVTITAANSPYQITSANELIMCDTTAGPITVYLPNATQFANYQFTVKCSADGGTGNAVSIQPLLAATPIETIDGLSALALTFPMSATPASDGSVWHTVSGYDQGGGGGGGGVSSFNTRTGAVVLNSSDVAAALPSSVVTALPNFTNTYTWSISGTLAVASGATNYIPPFYASVDSGVTVKVIGVRYVCRVGTVTVALNQNGSAVSSMSALSCTSSVTHTSAGTPPSVADGDVFAIVLSSPSSADGLTVTLILETTQ